MKKPNSKEKTRATYAGAGVDIHAGRRAVDLFKDHVRSTYRTEVVGDVGGFGGAFAFGASAYKDPLLVSGTDGVGTKVMIAQMAGVHDTLGIDLVAMSVNDVAVHGAEPLFFLDYIVTDKVEPEVIEQIVKGVADGCRQARCALLGGEVAEHPGHMLAGSYDLAGFCVGAVERELLLTGKQAVEGDVLLGIGSSGLHSNGYSLVRKVLLEDMGLKLTDRPMNLDATLAEELLRPTLIYSQVVLALQAHRMVKGFAHITGGGIPENLERALPEGLAAVIDANSWPVAPIFELISSLGNVEPEEMFSTFNMSLGMIAIVAPDSANKALDVIRSEGFSAWEIGLLAEADADTERVRIRSK